MKKLLALSLLLVAPLVRADTPFDQAENGAMSRDQRHVRDLYVKAAATESDPERRDQARIRAARIDWYILHDAKEARVELAKVTAPGVMLSSALAERSRVESELIHDFDTASVFATKALAAAARPGERDEALTRSADAGYQAAREQRDAGKCPSAKLLATPMAELQEAIASGGPTIERTRLLLDVAILAHDNQTALEAWNWYYADLPSLVPPSMSDRRAAGLALAAARLFDEADLVLRDPCVSVSFENDPPVQDVIAYAASVRRTEVLAHEHYRVVASTTSDDKVFEKALATESKRLWRSLSWSGEVPPYSAEAAERETAKRFGAVITVGPTEGVLDLLYGHRVLDETRVVEQYAHKGSLHFVQLDGIVSGGYASWATHGLSGTGGWIGDDAVYQLRPMYVDGPLTLWRRTIDKGARATAEADMTKETELDRGRVKGDEVAALPGLTMRLRRQYSDGLLDSLKKKGLQGDALRQAFLKTASDDKLASSIWSHEGRHAIDKAMGVSKDVDLEFRAKLSEVVFAPAPRGAMGSILSPIGGEGAHGMANARLMKGIVAWMKRHAEDIEGFDATAPTMTQLDRLTDEQLRVAFRSLDPLAGSRALVSDGRAVSVRVGDKSGSWRSAVALQSASHERMARFRASSRLR